MAETLIGNCKRAEAVTRIQTEDCFEVRQRLRRIACKFEDAVHQDLVKRAREARAKTPSAYIRAAALTGREFEVPSYATLRELINSMIETTAAITASPPGPPEIER